MNRGMAELRISRVGELAASDKLVAKRSLGAESEMIFGGFTVDEETRAAGRSGGGHGANAAALFADDKEKCEITRATGEKRFSGGEHGGHDGLGVAQEA